jgi:Carbamoylphosphate synthase large subunit (split gene in MJ)
MKGKNQSINILFLGGAKRVSLAERFILSAYKCRLKINIFSYELTDLVPIASIAKVIVGLKWSDRSLQKHLSAVIEKFDINIVLPFVDKACAVAAVLKEKNKTIFVPVSPKDVCELFFDKYRANKWFIENRIPVPCNVSTPPLIAKPRNGSASKDIMIIKDKKELGLLKNRLRKGDYLVQRYIDGSEYSIDCYVSMSGEIISIVPRKRLEVNGGEVVKSITVNDRDILQITRKILSIANFRGPITIQFIRERTSGRIYVMEVNPRFAGGVILSIAAGADIPMMIFNDYFEVHNKPLLKWKKGLLMFRAYREYFYETNH